MKKILAGLFLAFGLLSTPVDAQCVNCGSGGSGGGGGGGSGTVTDVSVVTANGFAGSVATSTTTPAVTLSTTVTGVVCGNGTALSACSAGSGVPGGSTTQLQYNNAGSFGGITGATTNGTFVTLTTPVLGVATGTSLALGGATLGSNAVAVTGTVAISSTIFGTTTASTYAFKLGPTAENNGLFYNTSFLWTLRSNNVDIFSLSGASSTAYFNGGFAMDGNLDTWLRRDAANTLAQRNGTTAQTYNFYRTFTDASNYERMSLTSDANGFIYKADILGTGTAKNIVFQGSGTNPGAVQVSADGNILFIRQNVATRWTIDPTGKLSNTSITLGDQAQVFAVTATQPASPTGTQTAIVATITSAGSATQANRALAITYAAGYTGSAYTAAYEAVNSAAGTASTLIGAAGSNNTTGNFGFTGFSNATTTGANIGGWGGAQGGNLNVGLVGMSQASKASATNIGGAFSAINTGTSPVMIGVFASLNQTAVPSVSAALIADNGAQTSDIFLARDNGSTVFRIQDGGVVTTTSDIAIGQLLKVTSATTLDMRTDGNLTLYNFALTGFGRVNLGGVTSSFPAIKRNAAIINIRLADDSADADITARTVKAAGFTVGTLPAAGVAGRTAYVTDQLTTCAVAGAVLTGGGAVVCPVFDNGVAWVGG